MTFACHIADAVEWANGYEGEPFHALLCDPPYHMKGGFMGKDWDKDGPDAVAFRPKTWAAFARVLHPGAFGMAFASSRGWHRLACAIEDAGLTIHPSVFLWAYGSGFPKATRIPHAEICPDCEGVRFAGETERDGDDLLIPICPTCEGWSVTAPWEGHRYGLQAMKPAAEPVIVFQKPYTGRPVDCITGTGAGALNIDGARIGTDESTARTQVGPKTKAVFGSFDETPGYVSGGNAGRWPANLALVHHPACNGACHPSCPVARLDAQSGERTSGRMRAGQKRSTGGGYCGDFPEAATLQDTYGDSGGASRFFYQAQYSQIDAADPLCYAAKASRSERDAGLSEHPDRTRNRVKPTGMERDPKWAPVIAKNDHPCVKPVSLARWLATLLLPPAPYAPRRLFIPFCGSGSEAVGAALAGWEIIEGVEMDPDHVRKAEARVAHWHAEAEEERRIASLQPSLFAEVA